MFFFYFSPFLSFQFIQFNSIFLFYIFIALGKQLLLKWKKKKKKERKSQQIAEFSYSRDVCFCWLYSIILLLLFSSDLQFYLLPSFAHLICIWIYIHLLPLLPSLSHSLFLYMMHFLHFFSSWKLNGKIDEYEKCNICSSDNNWVKHQHQLNSINPLSYLSSPTLSSL